MPIPPRFACTIAALFAAAAFACAARPLPEVFPPLSPEALRAAEAIASDPKMEKLLKILSSPEAQTERFDDVLELARIASAPRSEERRKAELTKRLIERGVPEAALTTNPEGLIEGSGVSTVDDLPVHNVCVRIPGSLSVQGIQAPKVLLEGHIDTVAPGRALPASAPYLPVRVQPISEREATRTKDLAALPELRFTKEGRVVKDELYRRAAVRYPNEEAARAAEALRIYVPGYCDAMINTAAVMQAAVVLSRLKVRPVYDLWICATAGEEGKGNLCGMKQLYGYDPTTGRGSNPLNFVANFGADATGEATGVLHYLGSARWEMRFTEPERANGAKGPSALVAANRAAAAISRIRTERELGRSDERSTYTAGVLSCTAPASPGAPSRACTLMVDARSPTPEGLAKLRRKIEPILERAASEENAAHGTANDAPDAVRSELVWFGDRPAAQRTTLDDAAIEAWRAACRTAGTDEPDAPLAAAASLNDNIPAALGVPTVNMNVGTPAASGGGHTDCEWGIPGDGILEAKRLYRFVLAGLVAAGYNRTDDTVVTPLAGPLGPKAKEAVP